MPNRRAVAEKLNIEPNMPDDIIFKRIAAAFQLASQETDDYSKDELVSVLLETIRIQSEETELQRKICVNLERQNSLSGERARKAEDECIEYKNILEELRKSTQPMMEQFQHIQDENKGLKAANEELLRQNKQLTEQISKMKSEMFGSSSEKMENLIEQVLDEDEAEDPLDEDCDSEEKESDQKAHHIKENRPQRRRKEKGFRDRNLKGLPVQTIYDYDIDQLNERYGEGNWRFVNWKGHRTVEFIRAATYVKVVYTPVISYGLEHSIETLYYEGSMFPKSLASASLLTNVVMDKFCMYVTTYRMENDINKYGFRLSRQTMSNWIIKAADLFFLPVYLFLKSLLSSYPYQQCDETTWRVIRDKRGSGKKSYFWVHRSSELQKERPPIILYELEPSRSGKHLEKYFREVFLECYGKIHLTSDAFSAYPSLEENHSETIKSCGCFSHARRRGANALKLLSGKTAEEDLSSLPEFNFINKIAGIYTEESKLKELSAEERLLRRQENIKPLVDDFFEYLRTLDISDPSYSNTFKDAVEYTLNQEKYLRRFLDDGNIPIDDNACERNVKSLVLLRKNCLFSNTFGGGYACGIIMTLVETARANDADPYWYIQYLLETMPSRYYRGRENENLEQMVPWSEEYHRYEEEQKRKMLDRTAPPGNEKPKTPRKKDQAIAIDQGSDRSTGAYA